MKVFVTGGTGFIGSHIVRQLVAKGHDVLVLSRQPVPKLDGAKAVLGSLTDPSTYDSALEACDAIIHNALIWGNEFEEAAFLDCQATQSLLELSERANVPRVIYMSSAAVHRPFAPHMDERSLGGRFDLYAETKLKNEALIREFGKNRNQGFLILRPGPVVGPPSTKSAPHRSDRRIESWVRSARQNEVIQLPSEFGRQFTSVQALAELCAESVARAAPVDTALVMSDVLTPWRRVADRIIKLADSRSNIAEPAIMDPPCTFSTEVLAGLTKINFDSDAALDQHLLTLLSRG